MVIRNPKRKALYEVIRHAQVERDRDGLKRGMNASFGSTLEQALEEEARGIAECVATPEFAEAMRSFPGRKS